MGLIGTVAHFFFARLVPLVVLLIAILIGWCNLEESGPPEGRFFATIIPLIKGYKPPPIVGHGNMIGTPPVPDDMKPEPRPVSETFLTLPGTNDQMPQNGLGMCCRPTAYDDVLVERSVLWFLLLGGRHIDGAHLYLNHRAIGRGIKEAIRRGVPREEIFFTTKVWSSYFGYNATKAIVPTFLEETGLDYIDMVLMHSTGRSGLPMRGCGSMSNTECRQDTWKALSELRKDGVVRNVGVSNFATRHLKELVDLEEGDDDVAPVANNQIQWNPWAPQEWVDAVKFCQEHGTAITAYNSLGGSLQHHEVHTIQILTDLSKKHNRSVAQIMLRWAIQSGAAVIPGTGNPNYMKENLSIYEFTLSEEEMAEIEKLRHEKDLKFLTIKSENFDRGS